MNASACWLMPQKKQSVFVTSTSARNTCCLGFYGKKNVLPQKFCTNVDSGFQPFVRNSPLAVRANPLPQRQWAGIGRLHYSMGAIGQLRFSFFSLSVWRRVV